MILSVGEFRPLDYKPIHDNSSLDMATVMETDTSAYLVLDFNFLQSFVRSDRQERYLLGLFTIQICPNVFLHSSVLPRLF